MTSRKIDFANLNKVQPDEVLSEILIGAGYIGTCLRLLPKEQRTLIEEQLLEGLADESSYLPDGAKTLIEATAKASSNPEFLAWIFNYVRTLHKSPLDNYEREHDSE